MQEKRMLLKMLKALEDSVDNIQQKGAGYYSATPFVNKYNKLLAKAKELFSKQSGLFDTLGEIEPSKSVDPADKMKTTQEVIIELNQLITFIESALEDK